MLNLKDRGFEIKIIRHRSVYFVRLFFLGPLPASDSVVFCLVRVLFYFFGSADYADHSYYYCLIFNVFEVSWYRFIKFRSVIPFFRIYGTIQFDPKQVKSLCRGQIRLLMFLSQRRVIG